MAREKELWERLLSSDVKADLLTLFHRNPKLAYSVDEITKQIGRARDEIDGELIDLLDVGIIKKNDAGLFCLDKEKDREIQDQISSYLKQHAKSRLEKRAINRG